MGVNLMLQANGEKIASAHSKIAIGCMREEQAWARNRNGMPERGGGARTHEP